MKLTRRYTVSVLFMAVIVLCFLLLQPWTVARATEVTTTYTITFQNWDGEVISSETYEPGAEIEIPADPEKEPDETYTYVFSGWGGEVSTTAEADATYKAQFEETFIDYTVTFKSWDGEVIASDTYHYGDELTVPDAPEREGYIFSGWGEDFDGSCKGDAEYTAQYTEPESKKNTATLSGPSTVRAGNTIKLTFYVDGTGLTQIQGGLYFDDNQLFLKETTVLIEGSWVVEFDGYDFRAYDETGENPINEKTALFSISFRVDDLADDTEIIVTVEDILVAAGADAEAEAVELAQYSTKVAPPKSSVNTLKSLVVANGTLSPAFRSDAYTYTVSVPFSVSKLDFTYAVADSKAKVSVNNPKLTAGETTKVTIKVTAEDGSSATYTISVKRESDPDVVVSSNNNLSGIRVGGFLLSPEFSPERTKYIIWLPYETDNVTVIGLTEDGKATARTEGGRNLVAGADNEIKVICTAENGEEKVYTVIAKRAPAHEDLPSDPGTDYPTVPPTTVPATVATTPSNHVCPTTEETPVAMIIIPWVVAVVAVGALLSLLLADSKKAK